MHLLTLLFTSLYFLDPFLSSFQIFSFPVSPFVAQIKNLCSDPGIVFLTMFTEDLCWVVCHVPLTIQADKGFLSEPNFYLHKKISATTTFYLLEQLICNFVNYADIYWGLRKKFEKFVVNRDLICIIYNFRKRWKITSYN